MARTFACACAILLLCSGTALTSEETDAMGAGAIGLMLSWEKSWLNLQTSRVWPCYQPLSRELTSPAGKDVSPAEYGYRLCKLIINTEMCLQEIVSPASLPAPAMEEEFHRHVTNFKEILCDPECPFLQAQSCYGAEQVQFNQPNCRNSSEIFSCVHNRLAELKCKSNSGAIAFWSMHKMANHMVPCASSQCHPELTRCLRMLLDPAAPLKLRKNYLCPAKRRYADCLSEAASELCNNNQEVISGLLDEIEILRNTSCSSQTCSRGGVRYIVTAGTDCGQYTQGFSAYSSSRQCPKGMAFDVTMCACNLSDKFDCDN